MTTRHLNNEARGYQLKPGEQLKAQDNAPAKARKSRSRAAPEGDNMNVAERRPLPCPSDWTFELIEEYDTEIARVAQRYGLDVYPIQLELISAEQMMDAYASVGMPVNYRHWSFGKHFLSTEKSYRRGQMGLAYEGQLSFPPVDRCPRDHRLPGLCKELHS
jgi:stage V sporulation protein R